MASSSSFPPTSSSAAVLSADHEFEARPSHRVAASSIQSDGDVWQEMLAVCEPPNNGKTDGLKKKKAGWGLMGLGNKQSGAGATSSSQTNAPSLVLRSYYECERTGKRVWDEPPSGASKVVQATDEMRQMAQLQLQELILSRSSAPESPVTVSDEDDTSTPTSASSSSSGTKSAKKKGFFGKIRGGSNGKAITVAKGSRSTNPGTTNTGSTSASQGRSRQSNRSQQQRYRTNDVQLQEAIARSLAVEGNNQTSTTETDDDRKLQEQIDLAKALSLSVQS